MTDTKTLFETVTLGNTTLDNRVGVAPMTRISATSEGLVTDQMGSYYTSFARGGFGLVITEGTYTDDKYSQAYFDQSGIAYDEQAQAWGKIVDSVHQAGAKIFCNYSIRAPFPKETVLLKKKLHLLLFNQKGNN